MSPARNVRIVLDSKPVISALYGPGPARTVLQAVHSGEIANVVSPFLVEEVSRALHKKLHWPVDHVIEAVRTLNSLSIMVHPSMSLSVLDDVADNRILECAVAGEAAFLVTGDHALLRLNQFEGISILSARQFLDVLKGL